MVPDRQTHSASPIRAFWDNVNLSSPPQRPGTDIFKSTVFQLWWRDPTVVTVSNTEGKRQSPAVSQGAGLIGKRNSRLISELIAHYWHIAAHHNIAAP